ncbi:MAG: amidohydrolase family protein [Verrucomicrobiota bacterium]
MSFASPRRELTRPIPWGPSYGLDAAARYLPRMGRRGFMMAAAASVAAGCASMHAPALLPILDTHTHFYDPQRPGGVRWPSKDDALLYRGVLPPEYETLARPLGIQGTVIVEASPDPEDNDWVLALMPRHSVLRGVIGHLSPADPGFPAQWTRWSRRPGFLGIRTGGWDGPLDTSRPGFVEHCRRVAADRRVLEVLVGPGQLPEVVRLARAIPDLVVVVDHCANVRIDGKAPPGDWLKGMDALADCPRVHVKVSGLVEGSGRDHGDAPSDAAFYQPVLDALWARFSDRRLVFGSNWPVSARFAPLPRVVSVVRDYLSATTVASARRVLHDNALRLYRI